MDTNADLPEYDDSDFINTAYPMSISVGDPAKGDGGGESGGEDKGEETISIDKLLEQYTDHAPGVFSIGGTFGIDSSLFQVELSDVYISVVNVQDDAGIKVGELLAVQGRNAFLRPGYSGIQSVRCERTAKRGAYRLASGSHQSRQPGGCKALSGIRGPRVGYPGLYDAMQQ